MSGSRRPRQKAVPGKARAVASHSLLCLSEETPLLPQDPCQAPTWEVLIPKTYILNTAGGSEYRLLLPISSLSQGCHPPGPLCVWPPWPWLATPSPPLMPTHSFLPLGNSPVASPIPHLFAALGSPWSSAQMFLPPEGLPDSREVRLLGDHTPPPDPALSMALATTGMEP